MPPLITENDHLEDELMIDDYDEEADSDFDHESLGHESESSSAEEAEEVKKRHAKSVQPRKTTAPITEELDSGDEATIKERQKLRKKQRKAKDGQVSSDEDGGEDGWRAKTRSMRAHETVQKQVKGKAVLEKSTIDVNRIWDEMNRPGPLPPVRIEGPTNNDTSPREQKSGQQNGKRAGVNPAALDEETITIKRQFKFAGEVHVEEKVVLKSSAEAKLWLAQQENKKKTQLAGSSDVQRPLRKISRFDPNYSNIEAFRNNAIKSQPGAPSGPKLNVVEKSKMDWASHVDAEGLKDELEVHAKAKDAYLNRMDFLQDVERRKEDEAKLARRKG